ncbi:MAG: sigma-70 family RNA polymerase sigma factor [Bryobacterales bacterium]|nr:sigma-70 family RNA polymerase sigma factor [Bryobacterales bacterium]
MSTVAAIDPSVIQQAEIRASRMVGNYGFSNDDWDDICQDLLLDYLKRRPRFNPDRGDHRGFAFGVLQNRAAKLAARQCRTRSFSQPDPEADWSHVASPDVDLDLRLDVQAVVARLPVHLRILARQLSEMGLADVLRQAGKSRSRVHQWIGDLRKAFNEAGLAPANTGGAR